MVANEGDLDALLDDTSGKSSHLHQAGGLGLVSQAALTSVGVVVETSNRGHDARPTVASGCEGAAKSLGGVLGGVASGACLPSR